MVYQKKKLIGFGQIVDICTTKKELATYFHKSHPLWSRFMVAIRNKEWVYIVNYEGDSGQAGYLKHELRKVQHPTRMSG